MVKLFMDFDSTITEETTLIQIYMRLPKLIFEDSIRISNNNYYKYEDPLTKRCYSNLRLIIRKCKRWEECLKLITIEMLRYSKSIERIEIKGMALIEGCLKSLDINRISRASSQIKIRNGFNAFINKFNKDSIYIISFNWSDYLIKLLCPSINSKNIISNKLKFKRKKCIGFDWGLIILTTDHKFNHFNNLKGDKNIFCGDSLPDLLPCLYSEISFAFISHDKEFLSICNKLRIKFSRNIYIINDFNEANNILNKINLI